MRQWTLTTETEARREDRIHDSQQPGFDLSEYVNAGRHREGCPAMLTPRQLDVLMRYVPGPYGLGMDVVKIAKEMKLNRKTIQRVCNEIEMKFPKPMGIIKNMRKVMFRQGSNMYRKQRTCSLDGMIAAIGESGLLDELVQTF